MEFVIALILITSIVMAGLRRIKLLNKAFAFQSLLIALVCLFMGIEYKESHYYILFVLTVLIKVFLIPHVINLAVKNLKMNRETELIINGYWSYLLPGIAVAVVFSMLANYYSFLFRTGIVLAVVGGMLLIGRKKAITQMIGLLTVENGIVLFEISMIRVGFIIELGIIFEMLVLALIMGIMIFRINKTFDTINTDYLSTLKE